jgi:hypothetical protein
MLKMLKDETEKKIYQLKKTRVNLVDPSNL